VDASAQVDQGIARWSEAFQAYHRDDGIISDLDLVVYLLYLSVQNALELPGDIAELGVFKGGPFALMTTTLKSGERAHAIDVFDLYFDHPKPERRFGNDPQRFQSTVRRIAGEGAQYQMVRADSRDPEQARQVLEKVGTRCRFFHVDGDHRMANVRADLPLAVACMADHPKPILAVDDTFQNTTPEVTEGLLDFLRANRDWRIFLLSRNKTFVCRVADHGFYASCAMRFLAKGLQLNPERIEVRHVIGDPCLVLRADASPEVENFDVANVRRLLSQDMKLPTFSDEDK
jgi:hypothetical protein